MYTCIKFFVLTDLAQVESRCESYFVVSNWGPAHKPRCSQSPHRISQPESNPSSHPHKPVTVLHSLTAYRPTLWSSGQGRARKGPDAAPRLASSLPSSCQDITSSTAPACISSPSRGPCFHAPLPLLWALSAFLYKTFSFLFVTCPLSSPPFPFLLHSAIRNGP